jgi:2'-5' RNA ligase
MNPEPQTVLLIPFPAADEIVGALRREHDPSARDGMPAHVTLLTPFVPLAAWTATHLARLSRAVEGVAPFEAHFRRTGRFGTTTLFLVPEPAELFLRLARAVASAFPEHPPYGGAYTEVLPHLTLAHGAPADTLVALEAATDGRVDIRARADAVSLFARNVAGCWVEGPRVPLTG